MTSTAIPLDAGRALVRSLHPRVFFKAMFCAVVCSGLFAGAYVAIALMVFDWRGSYAGPPIIVLGAGAYAMFGFVFGPVMSITGSFIRQATAFEAALHPCVEAWAASWTGSLPEEVQLDQKLIDCLAEGSQASPFAVTPTSNILLRGVDWIVARTVMASIRGSLVGQKLGDLQARGRTSIARHELQRTLAQQVAKSAADQLRSRLGRIRWICRVVGLALLAAPAAVGMLVMMW